MTNEECISDLKNIKSYFLENFGGTYPAGLDYAINMINSGDAVQYTLGYQDGFIEGKKIARPQGKWARTGQSFINPNKFRNFCCSNCFWELDEHIRVEPNFCQNCGADMRKGGTE